MAGEADWVCAAGHTTAVGGGSLDEVVGPDIVGIFRPKPDA